MLVESSTRAGVMEPLDSQSQRPIITAIVKIVARRSSAARAPAPAL
jgi:hypothetical protein